jgi:hypothetical protein
VTRYKTAGRLRVREGRIGKNWENEKTGTRNSQEQRENAGRLDEQKRTGNRQT